MADDNGARSSGEDGNKRDKGWLWLLLLLPLLALLGYYLLNDRDEQRASTQTAPAQKEQTNDAGKTANAAALTDLAKLDANARTGFGGRSFNLSGVEVSQVTGDKTFLVKMPDGSALLALLSDQLNRGTAENQNQVRAGQKYTMSGTVTATPSVAQVQQQWNISAEEAQQAQAKKVYLLVEKYGAPSGQ